jgi:hypothetical protein
MTFMIRYDGVVFHEDLGPDSLVTDAKGFLEVS